MLLLLRKVTEKFCACTHEAHATLREKVALGHSLMVSITHTFISLLWGLFL